MGILTKKSRKLFEHNHTFSGYCGGIPYLNYDEGGGVTDGIGRQHIDLYANCDICNKKIRVARIHVQSDGKLYGI